MTPTLFTILGIGLVVVVSGILALVSLVNTLITSDEMGERLETYALVPTFEARREGKRSRTLLIHFRFRLNSAFSMFTSEELTLKLMSANWPITETEYILIRVWGALGGLGLGWLFLRSIIPGLGIAFIAFLVPAILLNRSIHRRRMNFEKQLIDVLVLIKGAVQAGFSFLQALDIVVQEMKPPVSEEFSRVRREVTLGLPLSQALSNLNARMQNDDLYLVITAVNINSQVGGNMATMLEAVSETIRERVRLFSEVRAITSQQRFSGYLLTLLPFILVAILFVISPDYISRLFEPGITLCIPSGAFILVLLGNLVIRMMAKIEV
jgi:tight adherence protein B